MTVKSLYEVTRGILITFGTISVFLWNFFLFFLISLCLLDRVFASPVPSGKELW